MLSTNSFHDSLKLLFLSTLFAGFFLFAANYFYDNDSTLLVAYANALIGGKQYLNSGAITRYDIAYPLFLILTGYSFLHSLIGIALLNAIMAIFMPILVYFSIKPVFPKGAYYIALATIFSFAPFYYIKWVRPDHAAMFFTLLSSCLLIQYIDTKKLIFLFLMTVSVILLSLLRNASNIQFPFFILMAALFVRGSWIKYAIAFLISLSVLLLYSHFKHDYFSVFGLRTSFYGGQTFQNLYINSKSSGIQLTPDLGPAMQTITGNLYRAASPSPLSSSFISSEDHSLESLTKYISTPEFLALYVYPYSTKELMQQVFAYPCWEYAYMLYAATPDDKLFLKASWEIVRHYPLYPFAYISKNLWHFLYNPGFEHSRYTIAPLQKSNIRDAYSFNAVTQTSTNLPDQGIREIEFDTLLHKPILFKSLILGLKNIFCDHYQSYTKILFYFMSVTWLTMLIYFLNKILPNKAFAYITRLLPKQFIPVATILTGCFFINILILSIFVDPLLRYHNHIIPFKIMLAGMGLCILLQPFFQKMGSVIPEDKHHLTMKDYKKEIVFVTLMILILLTSWTSFMLIHTLP